MTRTHYIAGVWLALGIAANYSVIALAAWVVMSCAIAYSVISKIVDGL